MERKEFNQRLTEKLKDPYEPMLDCELLSDIVCDNKNNKVNTNAVLVIAIEELSELTKELTKHIRKKKNMDCILEELADVQIMIYQLSILFDIDRKMLVSAMQCKLDAYREKKENSGV